MMLIQMGSGERDFRKKWSVTCENSIKKKKEDILNCLKFIK